MHTHKHKHSAPKALQTEALKTICCSLHLHTQIWEKNPQKYVYKIQAKSEVAKAGNSLMAILEK